MRERLIERVLPYLIGAFFHVRETLTQKERAAQDAYMAKIAVTRSKTKRPVIVAIIGAVGSGKSLVARALAEQIGATVVEGDTIRLELGAQREGYERTRAIAENSALAIVKRGSNAVLDSDFADATKRASIRAKARTVGVRLVFIRVICDLDVMVQRMRENDPGEFFNRASTKSMAPDHGKDVKIREMIRRLPLHYRRINRGGGRLILKKLPFEMFAVIDTTDSEAWSQQVSACATRLIG